MSAVRALRAEEPSAHLRVLGVFSAFNVHA